MDNLRMNGLYETDFGIIPILDDSPVFFPKGINKPDYMTERRAYLAWKKEQADLERYEAAFNTMMEFLWANGKCPGDFEWRDGWLRDR